VAKLTELVHNFPAILVTCSPTVIFQAFFFIPLGFSATLFGMQVKVSCPLYPRCSFNFNSPPGVGAESYHEQLDRRSYLRCSWLVLSSLFVRGRWINRQKEHLMTTARSRSSVLEGSLVPSLALLKFLSLECWKRICTILTVFAAVFGIITLLLLKCYIEACLWFTKTIFRKELKVKAVMRLGYVLCGIVECAGVTLIWRVGTELGEAVKIRLTCLCSVFMVLIVPVSFLLGTARESGGRHNAVFIMV